MISIEVTKKTKNNLQTPAVFSFGFWPSGLARQGPEATRKSLTGQEGQHSSRSGFLARPNGQRRPFECYWEVLGCLLNAPGRPWAAS